MRWLAITLALFLCAPVSACLNDRDSRRVQEEAKPDDPMQGLPPIPNVLRGRFDRYPPLYYEMRRDRILAELETSPDQLALYDDIAVAFDRLGDDNSAIAWMDRKYALLEQAEDKTTAEWHEHWYSYHANQGTFYAHHWLHKGANQADNGEIVKARDLIARAIEIKPDAHFGREKYQLMAIEWIISRPELTVSGEMPNLLGLKKADLEELSGKEKLQERGLSDAIQGLSGLIVLGAAWESVDLTYALGIALRIHGDTDNAYAAFLRCKELVKADRNSFVIGAPAGERLAILLSNMLPAPENPKRAEALEMNYTTERSQSEKWRENRNAKITELLLAGRHPDTDDGFWAEVDRDPADPKNQDTEPRTDKWLWYGLFGLVVAAIGGGAFTIVRRSSKSV